MLDPLHPRGLSVAESLRELQLVDVRLYEDEALLRQLACFGGAALHHLHPVLPEDHGQLCRRDAALLVAAFVDELRHLLLHVDRDLLGGCAGSVRRGGRPLGEDGRHSGGEGAVLLVLVLRDVLPEALDALRDFEAHVPGEVERLRAGLLSRGVDRLDDGALLHLPSGGLGAEKERHCLGLEALEHPRGVRVRLRVLLHLPDVARVLDPGAQVEEGVLLDDLFDSLKHPVARVGGECDAEELALRLPRHDEVPLVVDHDREHR
mmetsp:Transcript_6471/g.15666  ORF Transcript_6471/g.15666 Transcript_6471/m.15666 type:complete len:263 (+) Transcript_6471:1149-1937(+)